MKSLHLFPVLFFTIFYSLFFAARHHRSLNHPGAKSSSSMPKIDILIYHCGFVDYPDQRNSFYVSFFIINNSNDTLKFTNTGCLFSKFYCVDNSNMAPSDDRLPFDSVKREVIPPHRGRFKWVNLKFRKMPDTSFKFKIGMKLVRWHNGNIKTILAEAAQEKPDTVWSNVKVVKTNKSHQISDSAEYYEYKEPILKKALSAFYPPITEENKRKYSLSIDQHKITPLRDTLIAVVDKPGSAPINRKYRVAICEAAINNKSNDTLNYISMSCSWLDMYKVNNNSFSIPERLCFSNYPIVETILPRKSQIVRIQVITGIKAILPQKIKIALSLQKFTGRDQFDVIIRPGELLSHPETSNFIWSNEIEIH